MVQEAFIRYYRENETNKIVYAKAWLYKTLHRLCVDHIRKRSPMKTVPLEAISNLEDETHQHLYREYMRIEQLLKHLPEEQATIVKMHFTDDLTFSEIADILGISRDTVKSRYRTETKLPNIHQKDKQLENTHISILPPTPKKILAKRHHPQKMKKKIDKPLTNKEIIPVNNIDDKEEISPILSNDIPIVEKPQSTFTAYERQLLENLEKNRYLVRACLAEELFQASVKQSKIAEIRNSYLQDALQLYENINEQIQEDIENLGKTKKKTLNKYNNEKT